MAPSKESQSKQHVRGTNFYTNAKDVKRKKMLSEGHRATRDKDGKILKAAPFQSSEATPGRIQSDRRWFGNTRVISRASLALITLDCLTNNFFFLVVENALTHFRESLAAKQADPYTVVLKQNKLPMSLLSEAAKPSRPDLVSAEPFAETFGPKAQRKRPRVEASSFQELAAASSSLAKGKSKAVDLPEGPLQLENVQDADEDALVQNEDIFAQEAAGFEAAEAAEQEGKDRPLDYILSAGTSKRIWGELYKVRFIALLFLIVLPADSRCFVGY